MLLVIVAGAAGCRALDRRHVAAMLNIENVPPSLSDIDCASFGFTDVLERCAFKIAPAEFDALLAGYSYVEPASCKTFKSSAEPCLASGPQVQSSHNFCCGPKVGSDFLVAHTFVANPERFEHGGSVVVVADRSRSLVMVDLYVE